jgi:hypothetical protein
MEKANAREEGKVVRAPRILSLRTAVHFLVAIARTETIARLRTCRRSRSTKSAARKLLPMQEQRRKPKATAKEKETVA